MSAHIMTERIQMALEGTRGTAASLMTLEVPFVGEGLVPTVTSHLGEIRGSAHFPSRTDMVSLGVTRGFSLAVELNKNNIRDIILLATKRTAGVLPSVTVVRNQHGLGPDRFFGCVCERLRLGFSRGGSPDASAVLAAQMDFQCMGGAEGEGAIASLTAAHASRFPMQHGVFTVSGVGLPIVTSQELVIANSLALGPPDADDKRGYIVDGDEAVEIRLTNYYNATGAGLLTQIEEQSELTSNSLLFATGTANETVTATMGKLKIGSFTRSSAEGAPMCDITLKPYHTGAAHQIAWTFGSAIGASVLGL